MYKVCISPRFHKADAGDGGIRRVVEALRAHLPAYGFEVVDDPREADVINCHAGDLIDYPPDKPMVASSHGLYWSNYNWPLDHYNANQAVIETMARAATITAPSRWVAHALRRGISRRIVPIHHGINIDDWEPGQNGGYVLWNKARADAVSDPGDLNRVAELTPEILYVTTLGRGADNMNVIGRQSYANMKPYIQNAAVYLATARETFGIGTLEALACGVPVAGWNYGGQSEIVVEGQTGYLAYPGDFAHLAECVRRTLAERERLSANARADAVARWQWGDKIERYAGLFTGAIQDIETGPKVSFIVTCYNLAKYLDDCLTSVRRLKFDDWECVVVNDASTDDTRSVARRHCVNDRRFVYREAAHNLGLSGARNFGFDVSRGRYILPLDADDVLHPEGVFPLIEALDHDPSVHIAYGNLHMMTEDGKQFYQEISQSNPFNWLAQMAHVNQPFYCAMMRRAVLRDTGGYRERDWRAEDAAFWARATSFGFRARKVTDAPTIFYRLRSDSKGSTERQKYPDGDGDWVAWYGWRIASDYNAGLKAIAKNVHPPPDLVPFGAQAPPPPDVRTWRVDHGQNPLISVIIPVGPGHGKFLVDALDSLLAQTMSDWEAVVCNDSGEPLDLRGNDWATVVETSGGKGAGYARNRAMEAARGDLVLFLDGDDWLLRDGMRTLLDAYVAREGKGYVYSNYISVGANGKQKHERMHAYNQTDWHGQHAVTILIGRLEAARVGGFDEALIGWEDWDFPIKLAIAGICGYHIPAETFVYRAHSGTRRDTAASSQSELLPVLKERYNDYYIGGKRMASCGSCPGKGAEVLMRAKRALSSWQHLETKTQVRSNGMTRMKFIGNQPGSKLFERVNGVLLKRKYRGGNNSLGRYINADPADVALLISTGLWEIEGGAQPATETNDAPPVAVNYDNPYEQQKSLIEHDERYPEALKDWAIDKLAEVTHDATPKAIEEAGELGVDLADVAGTGADGKITVKDVRQHAKSA